MSTKLIAIYFILTVIPMMILSYYSYLQYKESLETQIGEYIPKFLNQASHNIDNQIQEITALPQQIYLSEKIMTILRKDIYKSQTDIQKDQYEVNRYINRNYINNNELDIIAAFIYSKERQYDSSLVKYYDLDWDELISIYEQKIDFPGESTILLGSEISLRIEENKPSLLLMQELIDTDNRKSLGYVLLVVDLEFMKKTYSSFENNEHAQMWYMNHSGTIIYHTNHDNIGEVDGQILQYPILNGSFQYKHNGVNILYSVIESTRLDAILVHTIPLKELTTRTDRMLKITVILFISFVIVTSIVTVTFVIRIMRPIKRLIHLMKEVELGKFQVDSTIQSQDEMGSLTRSFNSMILTIRELIEKNYDIKIRQQEAELYALQSQINPHFIYNTLETINMAVEEGEQAEVVIMVNQLSRMLRYSVGNKSRIVTITDEVTHMKDYLMIQHIRFQDRLTYSITQSIELEGLYTPKFILQPIVENAIKYGLEFQDQLHIQIEIHREFSFVTSKDDIVFRIRDNGPGIKTDRMGEIEHSLYSETLSTKDSQFGLANVHARIYLLLGTEYGLQLHSIYGKGTEVTIRIPVLQQMDQKKLESSS